MCVYFTDLDTNLQHPLESVRKTLFDWFLSWTPTALNYDFPFPPLPHFLPPSPLPLVLPSGTAWLLSLLPSLVPLVFSLLLPFSGVLSWSLWTAGERLTTVGEFVCVCVCSVGGLWRWSLLTPPSLPHFPWPSLSVFLLPLLLTLPWPPPLPNSILTPPVFSLLTTSSVIHFVFFGRVHAAAGRVFFPLSL